MLLCIQGYERRKQTTCDEDLAVCHRQRASKGSYTSKPHESVWRLTAYTGWLDQPPPTESEFLIAQSQKICDETNMHLSHLYDLFAERKQTAIAEIAQGSKQLALDVRREQVLGIQIAEATKRGSSTMAAIAAVTMISLPGTFLASVFAVGFFDWKAPKASVVDAGIWIYWVITTGLTLLTMAGP
jgi:hypothetical protein